MAKHRTRPKCQEAAKKIDNCELCNEEMTRGELRLHMDSDECKMTASLITQCTKCDKEMSMKEWVKHIKDKSCKTKEELEKSNKDFDEWLNDLFGLSTKQSS